MFNEVATNYIISYLPKYTILQHACVCVYSDYLLYK